MRVGQRVESDDAESPDSARVAQGFTRMDGTQIRRVRSYFFLKNRVYSGYDRDLRTGLYNVGR